MLSGAVRGREFTERRARVRVVFAMTDISRSINLMANCICAAGTAAVLNRGVSWLVCHDAPWARTDERERVFEGMRPAIAADRRKLHPNV